MLLLLLFFSIAVSLHSVPLKNVSLYFKYSSNCKLAASEYTKRCYNISCQYDGLNINQFRMYDKSCNQFSCPTKQSTDQFNCAYCLAQTKDIFLLTSSTGYQFVYFKLSEFSNNKTDWYEVLPGRFYEFRINKFMNNESNYIVNSFYKGSYDMDNRKVKFSLLLENQYY